MERYRERDGYSIGDLDKETSDEFDMVGREREAREEAREQTFREKGPQFKKGDIINVNAYNAGIPLEGCIYFETEGFGKVKSGGRYGFVNQEGKVICDIKYDWVGDFHNGYARVKLDGKYGFINKEGEEICEIIYDNADDFVKANCFGYDAYGDVFAKVKKNKKWMYLDKEGNLLSKKPR